MKNALFISHAAAAIIITGIMLCLYAAVQQTYRSSANDPQLQIARDISTDETKYNLFSNDHVELTKSLATFVEIFDENGTAIKSTGYINNVLPRPPKSIFTNINNEDVITWQPQADVRLAMVFEKMNGTGKGFVASGRSLKETEIRENNLVKMIMITWLACMVVLFSHFLSQRFIISTSTKKPL